MKNPGAVNTGAKKRTSRKELAMHGHRVAEASVPDKHPAIIVLHPNAPKADLKPFMDAREQAVLPADCPNVTRERTVGRLHFAYDDLTENQIETLDICETLNGMMDAHGLDRIVRLVATVCQGRGVNLPQYLAKEVR
jgi:hypothetical protein